MRICSTAESVRVVSESEVLVMFVTPDGEDAERNISEWRKICKGKRLEMKIKEEAEKLRLEYI